MCVCTTLTQCLWYLFRGKNGNSLNANRDQINEFKVLCVSAYIPRLFFLHFVSSTSSLFPVFVLVCLILWYIAVTYALYTFTTLGEIQSAKQPFNKAKRPAKTYTKKRFFQNGEKTMALHKWNFWIAFGAKTLYLARHAYTKYNPYHYLLKIALKYFKI